MDLTLGPDQESVRDAVRGMLADRLPLARVRELGGRVDDSVWAAAGQLGWLALGLPETAGGAGYGLAEEMLLFIELGRALAPGPWLGTVLAAHALAEERSLRTPFEEVLRGERRVAVVDDAAGRLGDGAPAGTAAGVADGDEAAAFVVIGPRAAWWVERDGTHVEAQPSIDPTRPFASVRFGGGARLGSDPAGLRRVALVLSASEAVGVAERTLEMSVAYAKVRQQFGRPIGSFQAVKHRCADMAVRAEVARSLTTWAAVALRDGEADAERTVHEAKVLAVDAALANASDNVQNHGGMGYTWEADAHLYLKRAWMLEHAFGTRAAQLEALAAPWRMS